MPNPPTSSSWVAPTIVATIIATSISVGSTWLMRACDKRDAVEEKSTDSLKSKLDQIDSRLNKIDKDLSYLDGQIKVFAQIIVAPKGKISSVIAPSDSVQATAEILKGYSGFQILSKKTIESSKVPASVKSNFPSITADWSEITILKLESN